MRAPLSLLLLMVLLVDPLLPVIASAQTTEADVYVAQAVLDFDEKHYDAALENLRQALQLEADHVEALYYMGVVHMARRRPSEAVPFLLRARQKSPADPSVAFQLGLAYFGQQQYEQAEPLLEQVFRTQPTLEGLGYYVGFIRYRKKDYRGALTAFREGRATDPDIQQLTRFYAGLSRAVLGESAQAVAEVEAALRLAPGSPLTGPAERLRDTIVAARAKERRLSAEFRVGGFYDDNVAVVPNATDFEPAVGGLRRTPHKSRGELLGLRVDYSWLKHVVKTDAWDSTIGYSFFASLNDELPDFDVTNHLANFSLTHRNTIGTMPVQAGLQYAFDKLFLGTEDFIDRHTATLFGALVESDGSGWVPGHLTQLFGRFQDKEFIDKPVIPREDRDAQNFMAGFLHLFRFQSDAHLLKLGYQFDSEDAKGKHYEYRGHRLLAGVQYTLPWQRIKLKYDVDAHLRHYPSVNQLLPSTEPDTKQRKDKEFVHAVRAEYPFLSTCIRKEDCIAWTLSAEYQRTVAQSNIQVFDYTRNVFSLILSLSY